MGRTLPRFVFHDQNTDIDWYFSVTGGPKFDDDIEAAIQKWLDLGRLEYDYGIHDISFSPDTDVWGYTSYEIKAQYFPEVMAKWQDCFRDLGYHVGPVNTEQL